jgi:hypothetical protein
LVLNPWLKRELAAILAGVPEPNAVAETVSRRSWERWQDGLPIKPTLLSVLPPLRMILVLDNLAGHKIPAFVCWLFFVVFKAAIANDGDCTNTG